MQIEIPILTLGARGSSPGMFHKPLGVRVGLFIKAMYAKVFSQIFDSSIADDFRLRHFFMDLLVLADPNGVVDMTATAISARTRIPLRDVTEFLRRLETPDPESRTPDADGRRIEKLDEHRSWGWHIINYARFREIASEEQRREKTRIRVAKFKAKRQQNEDGNAVVTLGNAGNAMQKQKQMHKQKEGERENPPSNGNLGTAERIELGRSLERISKRLVELKDADLGRAPEERRELKAEKTRILGLLGLKA